MSKEFDCVEMKRKAARIINEKLSKLTPAEELEYWQEKSRVLKQQQRRRIKKHKVTT